MLNLTFNDRVLTQQEFNNLNIQERHAYVDEKMAHRIRLPYHEALKICRSVIDSDEKLTRLFNNFKEIKDLIPESTINNTQTLMAAFVDKFEARIFFVTREKLHNLSHYVYDVPSKQLLKYADTDPDCIIDLPPFLSNIEDSCIYSTENLTNPRPTIKEFWCNTLLEHIINTQNPLINDNFSINQEYLSDNHYARICKDFMPLDNFNEINKFTDYRQTFFSEFNPAHSTIDPDDLINLRITTIKNARSA